MVYLGHIIDGQVVLDKAVKLPEGATVCIFLQMDQNGPNAQMTLRGTPYEFDDPFAPATAPEDWEANA